MPVSRSPTSTDPSRGKAIRGRGGANTGSKRTDSTGGLQSPVAQEQVGEGSNPGSNKGKKKTTATESTRAAARSAARPTRNNPGDEPLVEGLPEHGERGAAGGEQAQAEVDALVQADNPPLLAEVRRLTNLLPSTPVTNTGRTQAKGADAHGPNEQVTPNNPRHEDPVVTPRHRQKEKVAADLIAAKKLFKAVSQFEDMVETQVTERKYDQLDELDAKQYQLETENATNVLVNSSLATVRRFPAEAAELTKVYQNNVTVLEYTRRILRDATHQLGQATGDQRPLEDRSQPGSPAGNHRHNTEQRDLPDTGPDGIDPLLRGEIPQRFRRDHNTAAQPNPAAMLVDLGTPNRGENEVGRNRTYNENSNQVVEGLGPRPADARGSRPEDGRSPPHRSQSQRREQNRPEQPPRSRESPDKFRFYASSSNTAGYHRKPRSHQTRPQCWQDPKQP